MDVQLAIADILRCSRDAEFMAAVGQVLEELDAEIASRNPVCSNRGQCCRFGEYGHNLFVTSVELAYFVGMLDGSLLAPPDRGFCPYQRDGRCTVRSARPAGCRVFFCDPDAADWQPGLTESMLVRLEAVGRRFGLEYAYLEWTDALRRLGGRNVDWPEAPGPVQVTIDIHERPSYHPNSGGPDDE